MGRAKLKLEYMSNVEKRNKTFKIRKQGLFKKLHELTTLCDVNACAIIYDGSKQEPEIWPNDRHKVRQMIELYKDRPGKSYTMSDFYSVKNREIKQELETLRKKNKEDKYPSWVPELDELKEPELRQFAGMLGDKLERIRSKIDELKRKKSMADQEELSRSWKMLNEQQGILTPTPLEMRLPHPHDFCYPRPVEQQLNQLHSVYQNFPMSMPTMLMNDYDGQADQEEFSRAYWNTLNEQQGILPPTPLEMILPHSHGYCYPGPAEQQLNQLHSVYQNLPMSMPTTLMNNCGGQAVYDQSTFGFGPFGAVNPMIYGNQGLAGAPMLSPEWLQFMPREN